MGLSKDVIDPEIVAVLRDVLAGDFPALIDTFLGDAPLRIHDLKNFANSGQLAAMEGPAHTLKGSSANVGAFVLAQACQELVRQCREGNVVDPAAAIAGIEREFARATAALLRERGSSSSFGAETPSAQRRP